MNLLRSIATRGEARSSLSFSDYLALVASSFTFGGSKYPVGLNQTLPGSAEELPDDGFAGLVEGTFRRNPIVFAVESARTLLFAEARFQWQRMTDGRPGDLWGNRDLGILERPWPGGTTGDLMGAMLLHADFGGTAFPVRRGNRIRLLRPDWVTVVLGSPNDPNDDGSDLDAELVGILYHPGGRLAGRTPISLFPGEFTTFRSTRDPMSKVVGIPWIAPVIREVLGDSAATSHKLRFFEAGATPNMVVSLDPAIQKQAFDDWIKRFEERYPGGLRSAYKTMYLGGGAKAEVVGTDLKQLDFKVVQGAGETRIAAAGRVPPIIVGLSEGLASATYSNYGQARRALADLTARPLWRAAAGALEVIVPPPSDSRLWVDDRDIPFLQEDMKDRAEIQSVQATAIRQLVDSGFNPATVVAAIEADDLGLLAHSGLYSVQLQPPNPDGPPADAAAAGRALAALVAPHLKGTTDAA